MSARAAPVVLLLVLSGCGESEAERFNAGYKDGYNSRYSQLCMTRSPELSPRWDDPAYVRGFRTGETFGENACAREKGRQP